VILISTPQLRTNTSQSRCGSKTPQRPNSRSATRRLSYFLVRSSSIDAARATVDHTHIDPLNELYLMPDEFIDSAGRCAPRAIKEIAGKALQRSLWHHTETPWRHFRSAELHHPFAFSLRIVFSQYQSRRICSDLAPDKVPISHRVPSADDANGRHKAASWQR